MIHFPYQTDKSITRDNFVMNNENKTKDLRQFGWALFQKYTFGETSQSWPIAQDSLTECDSYCHANNSDWNGMRDRDPVEIH